MCHYGTYLTSTSYTDNKKICLLSNQCFERHSFPPGVSGKWADPALICWRGVARYTGCTPRALPVVSSRCSSLSLGWHQSSKVPTLVMSREYWLNFCRLNQVWRTRKWIFFFNLQGGSELVKIFINYQTFIP